MGPAGAAQPISDVLILFGTTALGYACFGWFLRQPLFPIDEVVVTTPPAQVTAAQLEYAARTAVKGGFFTVDLDKVRQTFEKLPWVRKAEVRRHWPSSLEIRLEEHVAAAFWTANGSGETRLVNRQGEVFIAASNARMPSLAGPEGSAPLLLARYRNFGEAVAPLGHELVALSCRHARHGNSGWTTVSSFSLAGNNPARRSVSASRASSRSIRWHWRKREFKWR